MTCEDLFTCYHLVVANIKVFNIPGKGSGGLAKILNKQIWGDVFFTFNLALALKHTQDLYDTKKGEEECGAVYQTLADLISSRGKVKKGRVVHCSGRLCPLSM